MYPVPDVIPLDPIIKMPPSPFKQSGNIVSGHSSAMFLSSEFEKGSPKSGGLPKELHFLKLSKSSEYAALDR